MAKKTTEQLEAAFRKKVVEVLKKLPNTWVVSIQQIAIRGIPDIICCINGCFVGFELKRSLDAKTSELQKWNFTAIVHAGGQIYKLSPESWEETHEELVKLAECGLDLQSIESVH